MNKLILLIGGLLLSQSAHAEGISGADTAWIMTADSLGAVYDTARAVASTAAWCVPRTCSVC